MNEEHQPDRQEGQQHRAALKAHVDAVCAKFGGYATKRERAFLSDELLLGEEIRVVVSGRIPLDRDRPDKVRGNGIAVVTDQRVLFLRWGTFGERQGIRQPIASIGSVSEYEGAFLGGIEVRSIQGDVYKVKNIQPKGAAGIFVSELHAHLPKEDLETLDEAGGRESSKFKPPSVGDIGVADASSSADNPSEVDGTDGGENNHVSDHDSDGTPPRKVGIGQQAEESGTDEFVDRIDNGKGAASGAIENGGSADAGRQQHRAALNANVDKVCAAFGGYATKREKAFLIDELLPEEEVLVVVQGDIPLDVDLPDKERGQGIAVATNHRVLFLRHGSVGDRKGCLLDNDGIASATQKRGLVFGGLQLLLPDGRIFEAKQLRPKNAAGDFIQAWHASLPQVDAEAYESNSALPRNAADYVTECFARFGITAKDRGERAEIALLIEADENIHYVIQGFFKTPGKRGSKAGVGVCTNKRVIFISRLLFDHGFLELTMGDIASVTSSEGTLLGGIRINSHGESHPFDKIGPKHAAAGFADALRAQLREFRSWSSSPPPPETAPPTAPSVSSVADELIKLKGLLDAGAITEAEYEHLKAALIGDVGSAVAEQQQPRAAPYAQLPNEELESIGESPRREFNKFKPPSVDDIEDADASSLADNLSEIGGSDCGDNDQVSDHDSDGTPPREVGIGQQAEESGTDEFGVRFDEGEGAASGAMENGGVGPNNTEQQHPHAALHAHLPKEEQDPLDESPRQESSEFQAPSVEDIGDADASNSAVNPGKIDGPDGGESAHMSDRESDRTQSRKVGIGFLPAFAISVVVTLILLVVLVAFGDPETQDAVDGIAAAKPTAERDRGPIRVATPTPRFSPRPTSTPQPRGELSAAQQGVLIDAELYALDAIAWSEGISDERLANLMLAEVSYVVDALSLGINVNIVLGSCLNREVHSHRPEVLHAGLSTYCRDLVDALK